MSDAGDKPSATPDTEAQKDGPEADPADPADAISRAATVAAAWIPPSRPVASVGAGSVFGSHAPSSAAIAADEGTATIDGPEPVATIGPSESSARDHVENVPAEDIQVDSVEQMESVEDRKSSGLDAAADWAEDDDEAEVDALDAASDGPVTTASAAAALPADATPEARTRLHPEAAATVLSPGFPPVLSPVLLLVLTGIAVLILIVVIVGVLYMLDIL